MPEPRIPFKRIPDLASPSGRSSSNRVFADNLRLLKEREVFALNRGLGSLDRFKAIRFIPSLILRTLNDGLHRNSSSLSSFERSLLSAWAKVGLTRRHALEQVQRFYMMGNQAMEKLDRAYFELPVGDLDAKIVGDIRNAKFQDYYADKQLSPFRIESALSSRNLHALRPAEKQLFESVLLSGLGGTTAEKISTAIASRSYMSAFSRGIKAKDWRTMAAEAMAAGGPPPVTFYKLRAALDQYKIITSKDHIGGKADPRFIINSFFVPTAYFSPNAPYSSWKITYNSLGDDVSPCDWKSYADLCAILLPVCQMFPWLPFESMCDLVVFDPSCDWAVGTKPLIVVNAFEDDTLISDETRKYMDFGLSVAEKIAPFDPTGVSIVVVAIYELVWDLLCWLDDLDKDDRFYPSCWVLDETIQAQVLQLLKEIQRDMGMSVMLITHDLGGGLRNRGSGGSDVCRKDF